MFGCCAPWPGKRNATPRPDWSVVASNRRAGAAPDAAMSEGAPAGLERVGDVGEVPLRVRLQVGGQVA